MGAGSGLGRLTAVSGFYELPGDAAFCPVARRVVRAALADHTRIVDDAELVVSELFGNACRHTRSGEGGTLGVSVSALVTGLVVVSVADQGPRSTDTTARRERVPRIMPPDPLAVGWRGLRLVAEVADDWGYDPNDDGGLTVWAVFESPAFSFPTQRFRG
ncbi:ATP-binding protein [Allosalinactinospora lopnorensis]|uniref:ATP-binding protein n=1 Tax=Allosalinactinospora lopnorensis TaxID=1352348 RepID=UPI000623F89C|nr:ATP-binding protein [Allosalinactinospora lopnorensis]